jgi:hypothetical protein
MFFVIFWTYSLHIGNRPPYRESAGNALIAPYCKPWVVESISPDVRVRHLHCKWLYDCFSKVAHRSCNSINILAYCVQRAL